MTAGESVDSAVSTEKGATSSEPSKLWMVLIILSCITIVIMGVLGYIREQSEQVANS